MNIKSSITETHDKWHKGHIEPFWTTESFTKLNYTLHPFNNQKDLQKWKRQGYVIPPTHFTGMLCDMSNPQSDWTNHIVDWFKQTYSAHNVGTSYYRMGTSVILPLHKDIYKKYRELHKIKLEDCVRAVVFLEDWKSGHYFEIDNNPILKWKKGDYVYWESNVAHMAANIGVDYRYTLQLTGHTK